MRTLTTKKEALERIVNDKGLKERGALQKELAGAEEKLRERDAMVSRLERMLELANKERNRKMVVAKRSEDPGTISRLQREMAGLRAQLDAARASRPGVSPSPKKQGVPLPGIGATLGATQPIVSPEKAASPAPGWQAAGIPSNVASPEPNFAAQAALTAQNEAAEASRKATEEAVARTAAAEAAEEASRQAAAAAEAAARAAAADAERNAAEAAAEAQRQAANAEADRKRATAVWQLRHHFGDHFSRIPQFYTTPHAPCCVPCVVPTRIGC